jgi:LPXTG-motif cell wall-anchored protein
MQRKAIVARTLVGVLFAIGFVGLRVSSVLATAAPTATITIHKAECPTGVGDAIFEECHGNGLGDVDFLITDDDGDQVITTDDDGVASAEEVPGQIEIAEDPDVLDDYLGAYVYCSEQNSGDVLFDSDLDGDNALFGDIEAGDDVICDWYDITEAEDTGDDDDDGGTTLPSTGIGFTGGSDDASLLLALGLTALALGGGALGLRRRMGL